MKELEAQKHKKAARSLLERLGGFGLPCGGTGGSGGFRALAALGDEQSPACQQ